MHLHATPAEVFAAFGTVVVAVLWIFARFPLLDLYRPLRKQRLRIP
jgi:hypothetical protein